jgi:hypothetical protein
MGFVIGTFPGVVVHVGVGRVASHFGDQSGVHVNPGSHSASLVQAPATVLPCTQAAFRL